MTDPTRWRRIAPLALALVPALTVALYWIFSFESGESLSVAATYRYGDYNYFPLLAGLANFTMGEWFVFEHLGEGLRSFPFPALALHGVSLGLFGPAGFVVADLVVAVAAYFAAERLFRACGLSLPMARILALVVSCGLLGWPGSHLRHWLGWKPDLHLWGLRVPRPFLTDLFLMLCVGSWLQILVSRSVRQRDWALLGLWFGLLFQSRYYSATTVGLAIGFAALLEMLRAGGITRSLRALLAFTGVTVGTNIPFLLQRLYEHPDAPVRFGAFAVDRLQLPMLEGVLWDFVAAMLFAAVAAVLIHWAALTRRRERLGATLALGAICLLSAFALPVSTVLLGQTIQPYHFPDESLTFKTLVIIVALGQIFDTGAGWIARQLPGGNLGRWLGGALVAVAAAGCLYLGSSLHEPRVAYQGHVRRDFTAYRVRGYRPAFRALTEELGRERYAEARVLGTLDIQVLDWWSLFGGMQAFAPDTCATIIGDDEIEDRLLRFFRELGANEEDVLRLLNDRAVLIFFLSHAKYQVSRAHNFAPLGEYSPEIRRKYENSTFFSSWLVALPDSESKRLLERYARTREGRGDLRLDLIVLGPGRLDHGLAPDPEQFRLSFQNQLFRVFLRSDLDPDGVEP